MTLLVLILVFLAQRYAGLGEKFSRIPWVQSYLRGMQSLLQRTALWNHVAGIIIILLPFIIIIGVLQFLLHGWLMSIFRFFFDFLVLWFCLDAYQLKERLSHYFTSLANEDTGSLHQQGEKFIRKDQRKNAGEGLASLARAMTCEIFLRANEKLFGIVFWFIVLGPVGAATYFLIVTIRDLAAQQNSAFVELLLPANKVFGVVNWVPVRILALSYALMGHFATGFQYVRKHFSGGVQQTSEFTIQSGFAALNMEHHDVIHADAEENQAALSLVDRTFYLWIVFVAVFTLGGWL